ncbi:GNAT family N-acetyltransferase [Candidatus Woesearchaeota archaeon]|nr:GNAT family N-acetyltransferase [Candidatus Woesearchaeota archaeon]
MIIRKAKKEDLKQLGKMVFDLDMGISKIDFWKKDEKILKKNIKSIVLKNFKNPKKIILVAEEKNRTMGYITGSIKVQNPIFKIKKIGFINDVYIIKKFRKQGLGKKLMKELIKYFKRQKIKVCQLSVLSNNLPALKLYQSLGFKENRKKLVKRI